MSSGQDSADRLKTQHIDVSLGRRVREIREAMGLTRKQVAQGLAVSETRIQNYEDGKRISASRLWQFCGLYGVAVESLFEGLAHHVGQEAVQLAEEPALFVSPHDDAVVNAIGVAAAALNPVERRLALAALRGMGVRKLKAP